MADYSTRIVIQPRIPLSDITASEFLLLSKIFEHEAHGDSVYFFAWAGPDNFPQFDIPEVQEAAVQDNGVDSYAAGLLSKAKAEAGPEADGFDLDMSVNSFEFIFQDMVRRSATLDYVTAVSSYLCSKMRPDGFGGWAMLITADQVLGKSTDDIVNDFLDEVDPLHQFADRRAASDAST